MTVSKGQRTNVRKRNTLNSRRFSCFSVTSCMMASTTHEYPIQIKITSPLELIQTLKRQTKPAWQMHVSAGQDLDSSSDPGARRPRPPWKTRRSVRSKTSSARNWRFEYFQMKNAKPNAASIAAAKTRNEGSPIDFFSVLQDAIPARKAEATSTSRFASSWRRHPGRLPGDSGVVALS